MAVYECFIQSTARVKALGLLKKEEETRFLPMFTIDNKSC